jgi:hypothetical protein
VCEAGKDVDGHYKVSVPVVVFGKRFHHGSIGVPLVLDERGDHFASPELSVDLSVQTELFLCFQPFSDLGFSQHVFSFLADGLVQFVHATKRTRMLRVLIDLFQVVLISHRLIESSSRISTDVPQSICLLGIISLFLKATYTSLGFATNSKRTYVLSILHPPTTYPLL